jgi:nitroimidazol reductase NimA-like FMN-containing flavoprotein (pyridoxamine 5'-phosphate oxidase superfamily)
MRADERQRGGLMSVSYLPRHDVDDETLWPSPPDPGDLSRRIARRRGELRLSVTQLAARARLTQRYVEYLERYPARPDGDALRRLAAALLTSPGALLGGGASLPPGTESGTVAKLTTPECLSLIAPGGIGRIGFGTPSGPVILPVNYVISSGAIVLRTTRGTLIDGHAYEKVAFEVDHMDDALCQGWSVLVSGQAHAVRQPRELRALRAEVALRPWPSGQHDVYVRIVPVKITGRRIDSQ